MLGSTNSAWQDYLSIPFSNNSNNRVMVSLFLCKIFKRYIIILYILKAFTFIIIIVYSLGVFGWLGSDDDTLSVVRNSLD